MILCPDNGLGMASIASSNPLSLPGALSHRPPCLEQNQSPLEENRLDKLQDKDLADAKTGKYVQSQQCMLSNRYDTPESRDNPPSNSSKNNQTTRRSFRISLSLLCIPHGRPTYSLNFISPSKFYSSQGKNGYWPYEEWRPKPDFSIGTRAR
ncbi:hypothetical protein GWI33_013486 [Rhynchophorus ferrugineus]|uniref:Uncharacterized protein n=1 Tax=Rhynchophorus ferrugineus TaxID=354439 RepID=A0A834M7T3_RHYFE|nr:hypothetical protein GWI33_013486 [Rhynchophorus ferrugineus]